MSEAFFALSGGDGAEVRWAIHKSDDHSLLSNGIRYVGANPALLETGEYFYGFSHIPAHELTLPPSTFQIAILRDPVDRIMSNYRMALRNATRRTQGPWISLERSWLGNSILDFCRNMPKRYLYAQLYAFSSSYDPSEAAASIATCDAVFFTEQHADGISQLATTLRLNLAPRHVNRSPPPPPFSGSEISKIERLMEREIELLELVRRTAGVAGREATRGDGLDYHVGDGRQR